MADIDHGRARGGDLLDDAAQFLDAGIVERRGRFVEEQDRRIGGEGLDDLEELPLRGIQVPDECIGRDVELVGGGPRRDGTVGDAEQEVLSHRQLADQRIVLIDSGEPEPAREERIGARQRLAHDPDLALIGGRRAAGDAKQRALAGAVLAEHGVDLARPAFEADAIERLDAGIALRNAGELERGGRHGGNPRWIRARMEFAPAASALTAYFANIAFIVSSSTKVETEASSGKAGLHMPLTTGFILKGTSIFTGTSWPAFFIIAAVKAKRDWSFWPLE